MQEPESLLIRAFAYFTLWEYERAIPHVRELFEKSVAWEFHFAGSVKSGFRLC